MDTRGIDQMLSELRATSQVASGKAAQAATAAGETDFGHLALTAQVKQPLHIYPNPVSDNITISGLTQQDERYVIYTISGICVQQGAPEFEIDVQNLQSGLYLIQIGNTTASFIKQ